MIHIFGTEWGWDKPITHGIPIIHWTRVCATFSLSRILIIGELAKLEDVNSKRFNWTFQFEQDFQF